MERFFTFNKGKIPESGEVSKKLFIMLQSYSGSYREIQKIKKNYTFMKATG